MANCGEATMLSGRRAEQVPRCCTMLNDKVTRRPQPDKSARRGQYVKFVITLLTKAFTCGMI